MSSSLVAAEYPEAPVEPFSSVPARQVAAQARFPGLGHHLLERRVGGQRAFDDARVFRIRAGDLGGRRRAVGFRIPAVSRQARKQLVGQTRRWVEAIELVDAVQIIKSRIAGVLDLDAGVVPAAADGHGELVGEIERVDSVDADVVVQRGQRARRDFRGLVAVARQRDAGPLERHTSAGTCRARSRPGRPHGRDRSWLRE